MKFLLIICGFLIAMSIWMIAILICYIKVEKVVRWLIARYLPGFHLHHDPRAKHKTEQQAKANDQNDLYDFGKELPPGMGGKP